MNAHVEGRALVGSGAATRSVALVALARPALLTLRYDARVLMLAPPVITLPFASKKLTEPLEPASPAAQGGVPV